MTKIYFKRIIAGIIIFYVLFLAFINKPTISANEEPVEQQTEEQTEELKKEANESSQQVEKSIGEREEKEKKEAERETYVYQTVNMYPEHYEGSDDEIYYKCTYVYNCVFVPPDDPNFEQYDVLEIDGVNYTVMEKTSNCNCYYNSNATYSRGINCVEFWDNETYNKKEIEIENKGD